MPCPTTFWSITAQSANIWKEGQWLFLAIKPMFVTEKIQCKHKPLSALFLFPTSQINTVKLAGLEQELTQIRSLLRKKNKQQQAGFPNFPNFGAGASRWLPLHFSRFPKSDTLLSWQWTSGINYILSGNQSPELYPTFAQLRQPDLFLRRSNSAKQQPRHGP